MVRILAFVLLTIFYSPSGLAQEPAKTCEGFRYVFMESPEGIADTTLRFAACRNIREPSSRPVNCEVIGELDITELKVAAFESAGNLWEFKKGVLIGASCVIAAETLSYANMPTNLLFRAYNSGGEKVAIAGLQEEVRSGKRKLGELPLLESRVPGPAAKVCSFITSRKKNNKSFASGAMLAIKTFLAVIHQTRALRADAKLLWQIPIEQRAAKHEEYKRNVAKSQGQQVEALAQGFNASRFVYEYLTEGQLLDVPVGTTGDIAVVSPDTCISDSAVAKLKGSLETLKQSIATGKLPFGEKAPSPDAPKAEEPPTPPEVPSETPFNFPI